MSEDKVRHEPFKLNIIADHIQIGNYILDEIFFYANLKINKMKEDSTYPKSPFIKLFDNKRTFYYKIIKVGTYPPINQLHYTRNPKHPIPHNYIVETQYGKAMHAVECSINYVKGKPLFKVHFGADFTKEVHSLESATVAACKYYQVLLLSCKITWQLSLLSNVNA